DKAQQHGREGTPHRAHYGPLTAALGLRELQLHAKRLDLLVARSVRRDDRERVRAGLRLAQGRREDGSAEARDRRRAVARAGADAAPAAVGCATAAHDLGHPRLDPELAPAPRA